MGAYIQDTIRSIANNLSLLFKDVKITDFIDILIVAFIIYELIVLVRNTRASQLAKGVLVLVLFYAVAAILELKTLLFFLQAVMQFGIIVIAVVFQPELRRAIEQVGGVNSALSRFFRPQRVDESLRTDWQKAIAAVCDAAERMADARTGALIVLERNTNLNEILRTGTPMDSEVNVETLGTVFYEGTPLHDGAVLVRDARIAAAGCFLPLSDNLEISKDMGTRHRSALGMSENSDAVVVVVSEEAGVISLAKSGVLIRRLDRQTLYNLLVNDIIPAEPEQKTGRLRSLFRKKAGDGSNEE